MLQFLSRNSLTASKKTMMNFNILFTSGSVFRRQSNIYDGASLHKQLTVKTKNLRKMSTNLSLINIDPFGKCEQNDSSWSPFSNHKIIVFEDKVLSGSSVVNNANVINVN